MRALILFSILMFAGSLGAVDRHVSYTGTNAYTTISAAEAASSPGDRIFVHNATNYAERVTVDVENLTFIGDGTGTNCVVTNLGWSVTANNVRIIRFKVTHPSAVGYEAVRVNGATNCQVLLCDMYKLSESGAGSGITFGNANFLVARGNRIHFSGSPNSTNGTGAKAIGEIYQQDNTEPALFEANTISETTDYITPSGRKIVFKNNVLGPTTTNLASGAAHVDGFQPNAGVSNAFMEANWHVDNAVTDSHLYLDEVVMNHIVLKENVSDKSGDTLTVQWRVAQWHFAAHNTYLRVGYGPRGGPANGGVFYVWDSSSNNFSGNSVFVDATSGSSLYALNTAGQITTFRDLSWPFGTAFLTSDPKLYSTNTSTPSSYMPSSDSPLIGVATNLTVTSGGATNASVVTVAESRWFRDGFGICEGHKIYVGAENNLTVTAINWSTHEVTVDRTITWTNNTKVGYAYLGNAPTIGAFAYRTNGYDITATIANQSNIHTVTTDTNLVSGVWFLIDDIPERTVDYTHPFTITNSGTVTAFAMSRFASPSPMIFATEASDAAAPGLKRRIKRNTP
jgi:hypothetical protein